MFPLVNAPFIPWLVLYSIIGAVIGVFLSWLFPGGVLRARLYPWRPRAALLLSVLFSSLLARGLIHPRIGFSLTSIVVFLVAILLGYLTSRMPDPGTPTFVERWLDRLASTRETVSDVDRPIAPVEQMVFKHGWKARPKFETSTEGSFVGRNDLLGRLSSQFISKGGGTILISGVRGVGKTALVDRALVDARNNLALVYWSEAATFLEDRATPWHPIDMLVRRTLIKLGGSLPPDPKNSPSDTEASKLMRAAEEYSRQPVVRFWGRLNPVGRRIRDMHAASNWQIFVLKFSASDISGALAEPEQKQTGKPRIDPEKLLRSLIRKLYMTLHTSSLDDEARVLQKSLCTKKQRQLFIHTLEKAFDKSVSKSYKEIVSNSISDFIKDNRASVSERKFDVIRILIALAVIGGAYEGAKFLYKIVVAKWPWVGTVAPEWYAQVVGLAAGGIGLYITWTVTTKRTRERGSDRSQQSQFSLEYDFSIERMQRELESLMNALQPADDGKFYPYRCFTRSAVIFDELDKLENADKQLDDVITHFKNFFTLSNSVFVFLTDHEFYEYLNREAIKAQRARHYSPQHTFFNEKIYLRKPEFARFREAFYRFTNPKWIQKRVASLPSDPGLIDYLLAPEPRNSRALNGNALDVIASLPLPALTHLYIRKEGYADESIRTAIESAFISKEGRKDALALAHIWASQARSRADNTELKKTKKEFEDAGGPSNAQAVSYLYFCKDDFENDRNGNRYPKYSDVIAGWYQALNSPSLKDYQSIKRVQFPLGDLAQALCFQTRNHYFDLYQLVYDYISDYLEGLPVIALEDKRFAPETRLASRYQRLLEVAFDSVKEDHPSREYFNGLLMESLYAVFDKRGTGAGVKVGDILFHDDDKSAKSGWLTQKNDDRISPYTGRDVEKINHAIVALLQLLLEHNAISSSVVDSSSPNFEAQLNANVINWTALGSASFEWNDDVQSVIKLTSNKEPHEEELVRFWKDHKGELEAFDNELARLWTNATMPDDAAKLKAAIRELRGKTDAVRLRSIKVSETDAEMLKASVMTPEARRALMSKSILDRIKAEDDAFIVEEAIKGSAADEQAREMDSRRKQFEAATGVQLRALISPRDTDYFVFFASGPVPPDTELNWANFPKANDYVLWYSSAKQQLTDPNNNVWFYYPPSNESSARALFDDYCFVATKGRLSRIVAHVQAAEYKDTSLAVRAGAEAVGFIGAGSSFQIALSRPELEMATTLLDRAVSDFQANPTAAGKAYNTEKSTTAYDAIAALTDHMANSIGEREEPPFDLKLAINDTLRLLVDSDVSNLSAQDWLRLFASGRTSSFTSAVIGAVVNQVVAESLRTSLAADPSRPSLEEQRLLDVARKELVSWINLQILAIAEVTSSDVKQMLATADWATELEKRRRGLRSTALPPKTSPSRFPFVRRARRASGKNRKPGSGPPKQSSAPR
ncbi:MAG TPA: ATP-binding protein [Pyrinomonadaceae bacterium]|nr:ATP-binding protein [Pyrinomonadaceae bacterium]